MLSNVSLFRYESGGGLNGGLAFKRSFIMQGIVFLA